MVDKTAGVTSHDVVNIARRALKTKAIGHTGTLDKPATGLLVLLIGRATKLSPYLLNLDKKYECSVVFGITTSTDDDSGKITGQNPCTGLDEGVLRDILKRYEGPMEQKVPRYSSVQVGGRRLYKLAVKEIEFEQPVRDIFIFENKLLDYIKGEHPQARIFFHCSKGTYIRALARDIGEDTGCGAHLKELKRTSIGGMSIEDAISIEMLKNDESEKLFEKILPMEQAVSGFPSLVLKEGRHLDVQSGKKLITEMFSNKVEAEKGQIMTVLSESSDLIALVEAHGTLDWSVEDLPLKYLRVIKVSNDAD